MPPRLAIIGPFPPLKGGISQHTARLSEACEQAGAAVQRYSWAAQYPKRLYGRAQTDPAALAPDGVRCWLRWWNPISWLRTGWAVRHHDAVVLPWVTPLHAPSQWVILAMARNPARIIHVHNARPHERLPMSRFLTRSVLRKADLLVSHASSIVDELRDWGIDTPAVVTPHAPDIPVRVEPLPDLPPVRLLFLGTVRPYKGIDLGVEAAEALHRSGLECDLTIAGEVWDETEAPSLEELSAMAIPVDARYRYCPDGEVADLLASHHLVLAPYRTASQSGVVPLAFAAGRPVVATRVGGLAEVVREGVNGTLAEPDDVDAFRDAIERAIDSLDTLAEGALVSRSDWSDYADLLLSQLSATR